MISIKAFSYLLFNKLYSIYFIGYSYNGKNTAYGLYLDWINNDIIIPQWIELLYWIKELFFSIWSIIFINPKFQIIFFNALNSFSNNILFVFNLSIKIVSSIIWEYVI